MKCARYLRYGGEAIKFVALRGDEVVAEADTHGDLVRILDERGLDAADVVFAAQEVVPEAAEDDRLKRRAGV